MTPSKAKQIASANGLAFKYLTGSNQGKPYWVLMQEDAMGHSEDFYPGELSRCDEEHFMWAVKAVQAP